MKEPTGLNDFRRTYFKNFKKKSKHFELLSKRRYILLWKENKISLSRKIIYKIKSQFYQFYFDDSLPSWRKKIRQLTNYIRYRNIDFFVLSPIKVGSSQLALTLFTNPSIVSPAVKEFLISGNKKDSLYYPIKWGSKKVGYVAPFLFEPRYRKEKYTLDSIKTNYPNAKLIIGLRDPIKRAYSHWKWEYFLAGEKNIKKFSHLNNFDSYVELALKNSNEEPSNYSGFSFLKSGLYSHQVSKLIEENNKENLFFIDMDLYFKNPNFELKRVQEFIGLEKIYQYPDQLPFLNENPLSFDNKKIKKETYEKLKLYYQDDIKKLQSKINLGSDWLR